MGVLSKDDVKQAKLNVEPKMELPSDEDTNNYQYNEVICALPGRQLN